MATRFYESLSAEAANVVHQMTRASFDLKDSLSQLLSVYDCRDVQDLRVRLESEEYNIHPIWDHYLAARCISVQLHHIREALRLYTLALNNASGDVQLPTPVLNNAEHLPPFSSIESLVDLYGERMRQDLSIFQDAVTLHLDETLDISLRATDDGLFSIEYRNADTEGFVDNAASGKRCFHQSRDQRQELKDLPPDSDLPTVVQYVMSKLLAS